MVQKCTAAPKCLDRTIPHLKISTKKTKYRKMENSNSIISIELLLPGRGLALWRGKWNSCRGWRPAPPQCRRSRSCGGGSCWCWGCRPSARRWRSGRCRTWWGPTAECSWDSTSRAWRYKKKKFYREIELIISVRPVGFFLSKWTMKMNNSDLSLFVLETWLRKLLWLSCTNQWMPRSKWSLMGT